MPMPRSSSCSTAALMIPSGGAVVDALCSGKPHWLQRSSQQQ